MDFLTLSAQPAGEYQNITNGRVRVRDKPGGKRIGWLEADGVATVLRWLSENGKIWAYTGDGYIRGDCLGET